MTTGTWHSRPSLGSSGNQTASYTNDSSNAHPELSVADAAPTANWEALKIPYFVGDGGGRPSKLALSGTMADYWTRTTIAGQILFKMQLQIGAANAASPFEERQLIASDPSSVFGVSTSTDGCRVWMLNSGVSYTTVVAGTLTDFGVYLVQWSYDGATLKARLNSDAWVSTAGTSFDTNYAGQTLELGHGVGAFGGYFEGYMRHVMLANRVVSEAEFDNWKRHVNDRFGLSL